MPLDKVKIHRALKHAIQGKIDILQQELDELLESLHSSTKSSVGDKHETSRALLQIEQERIGNQLTINQQMIQALMQIDPSDQHKKVQIGSLIETNVGTFYLSVSGGQIKVETHTVFCLTPISPMGSALINKGPGEQVVVNDKTIDLIAII